MWHISQNWSRQACPLLPLAFILRQEPFLKTIRAHQDIRGISIKDAEHKLATYVDELIFFVTSSVLSLLFLLQELRHYETLLNPKINYSKSEALRVAINHALQQQTAS